MLAARIKWPDELSGLAADASVSASKPSPVDYINAIAKAGVDVYTAIKPPKQKADVAAMMAALAAQKKEATEEKDVDWMTYALIGGGVLLLGVVLAIVLSKGKK